MKSTSSRYRMKAANLLPKFGSAKNPFAGPSKTESPVAEPEPAPPSMKPAETLKPAKAETPSLFEPKKPEAIVQPKAKASHPVTAAPAGSATRAAKPILDAPVPAIRPPRQRFAWIKKLNPKRLLPSVKPAKSKPVSGPVQPELLLERVKVVRNDLSDTDVEIVPGRLMGLPSGASPVLPNVTRAQSGAWDRLTSRFFGVETTQTH